MKKLSITIEYELTVEEKEGQWFFKRLIDNDLAELSKNGVRWEVKEGADKSKMVRNIKTGLYTATVKYVLLPTPPPFRRP